MFNEYDLPYEKLKLGISNIYIYIYRHEGDPLSPMLLSLAINTILKKLDVKRQHLHAT